MDRLARAWAFERSIQDRLARRVTPFRFGSAIFSPDIPRVYDANLVRVEHAPEQVGASELIDEVERLQDAAGLAHRKFVVPDERLGQRLAPGCAEEHFAVARVVVMAYEGPRRRSAPALPARRPSDAELRATRVLASSELSAPGAHAANPQLTTFHERLAAAVETHLFASPASGEIGSYCELVRADGVAEIDEVTTLLAHRGRGLGRAVVEAALAAALAAGDELVFLVADDRDWPKDWYARIGFVPIGRRYEFTRV